MLKIDIDEIHNRTRFELQRIMYSCPRPFFIRLSSSRAGLHLAVPGCGEWDYRRYAYDDPMRINLDTQRRLKQLPVRNLLWDVKNGRPAGEWRVIRTERNIEDYIDAVKSTNTYLYIIKGHMLIYAKERRALHRKAKGQITCSIPDEYDR